MTFSIAGVCEETNEIGFAVATSSVCVGARCGAAVPGKCVVFSQAKTNPLLHRVGIDAFLETNDVDKALEAMISREKQPQWRQLGILSATGEASHFSGESCLDVAEGAVGKGCLALGNAVSNTKVIGAMVAGFEQASGPLAYRLISGLKSGEDAGAEIDPLQSTAIRIYGEYEFPITDLRIDKSRDPIGDMFELWEDWAPKLGDYIIRAINPDQARPSREIENVNRSA
jgi:uncharacterized Ntn-hydrolase superfamily protein